MTIPEFQDEVWNHYRKNKRILPWREHIVPYHVLISEIMLQQTQVPRVLAKFPSFISHFPDFKTLAEASLSEVLREWQGMGYNRRGKYLKETAGIIHHKYKDQIPTDPEAVDEMPGIGPATARSIITFVYNTPQVFIETNIRRVFIHHFFTDAESVDDTEILPLVMQSLPPDDPREWYYALMDYGSTLAKLIKNPNRKSKQYTKQSRFEGSKRQVRGAILREVLKNNSVSKQRLLELLPFEKGRGEGVLSDLVKEGLITEREGEYSIKE
jgi:A/G-specific adenine glycosylase